MMTTEEMRAAFEAEPGKETILRLAVELGIDPMEVIDRLRACGVKRQRFSHIISVLKKTGKVSSEKPTPAKAKREQPQWMDGFTPIYERVKQLTAERNVHKKYIKEIDEELQNIRATLLNAAEVIEEDMHET